MALMRSNEPPKDAVRISEAEAVEYAWNMVMNWDSFADSWALRWGPAILGGVNAACGIMISQHYRKKLKVGRYGFLATLIPVSMMPGTFTVMFHRHYVGTNLLLMRETCPVCTEVKSAAIQVGLGIAYPMLLGPWATLMIANRYNTFRIPSLVEKPKELLKFTYKLTKPYMGTLTYMFAFQVILSSVMTYFEQKNNITLRRKLIEIENNLTSEKENN